MIREIAILLGRAERDRSPLLPLTQTYPELTPAQPYTVQSAWLELKLAEGARLAGRKIGLTSRAMQEQLGVDQPDFGFLLDRMLIAPGSTLARAEFIQPRLEPEIAFWLADDLRGPGITAERVLAATRAVSAALELVDSRIANWRIKLADTIADNGSSSRAIISEQLVSPSGLDLAAVEVTLTKNGQAVGSGNGAAVLGHPAAAVAWLANALADFGDGLLVGQVVLPGAMCASVPAATGDTFRAVFTGLGEISVRFA